jgi:hypothetical protein
MAIEYDISGLLNKTENEGSTDAGRLTSTEWNKLVSAVQEVQTKSEGTMKGIKYNGGAENGGQTFSEIDSDGYLKMTVADSSGYQLTTYVDNPPAYIARGSECIIKVRVSSKQVQGDDLIPATATCSVNFYLNGAPSPFYTGNVYDLDSTTPGAVKELVVDIAKIPGVALLTGELDNAPPYVQKNMGVFFRKVYAKSFLYKNSCCSCNCRGDSWLFFMCLRACQIYCCWPVTCFEKSTFFSGEK